MTTRDQAIDAFKEVIESREPVHERIIGQLGDAAGVVEVPGRANFNYVRLSGATTRTVRAMNLAVMPELDRYVWVEISRIEGEPKYYRVVGYSEFESEASPADPPVYPGGQSAAEKVVVWTAGTYFTNEKLHNVLSGAELHDPKVPIDASDIELEEIATATYDDVQDWINSIQSAGRISGGVLSQNVGTPSTLDVTAGTGFIKTVDSVIGTTKFFDWSQSLGEALADGEINFVYVNYNVGTQAVTIEVTDDRDTIPLTTAFTLGRVYRDGDELHIITTGLNVYNRPRANHERLLKVRGFERASGGVIAEKNQRYLTSTAGVFFLGLNEIDTLLQDTTGAARFTGWYLLNGTWTTVANQQQVDNLQYNDVSVPASEALANLTVNRYGVFWVYIHMDDDINVIYGQDNYKLNDAEDAILPGSLPEKVTSFGILAAKIIVQQGQNNLLSVVSAYDTAFPVSSPANHNDLGGLQGGTADEYYHLTAAEHGYVSGANSQSLLTTAAPSFAGMTLVKASAPVLHAEFTGALTDIPTPAHDLQHTTSGDMVDGFGVGFRFLIKDPGATEEIASIYAVRDGADNEGKLILQAGTDGAETILTLSADLSAEFAGDLSLTSGALDVNSGTVDIVANFESSDTDAEILISDSGGFIRLHNKSGVFSVWTAAQALTVLANGNVGLEDISPSFRLVVQHDGTGRLGAHIKNTTDGAGNSARLILNADSGAGQVQFEMFSSSFTSIGDQGWLYTTGASTPLILGTVGAERVRITTAGDVGIGMTPEEMLSIFDSDVTTNFVPGLRVSKSKTSDAGATGILFGVHVGAVQQKGAIAFERTTSYGRGSMHFCLDAAADNGDAVLADAIVTITYAGRVGIGTTTPQEVLNAVSTNAGNHEPALLLQNLSTTDGTGTEIQFGVSTSNTHISAAIGAERNGATSGGDLYFITRTDGGTLTERIRVLNTGNVGIGTTAPGQILDVNAGSGNMIADGYDSHPSFLALKVDPVPMSNVLERFKQVPSYKYKRTPYISATELMELAVAEFGEERWDAAFPDGYRGGALHTCPDVEIATFLDTTGDKLREQRQSLPKWQRLHYGLAMDDLETTFPGILSRDEEGVPSGYSLNNYVGVLHGCISELVDRVEYLEAA